MSTVHAIDAHIDSSTDLFPVELLEPISKEMELRELCGWWTLGEVTSYDCMTIIFDIVHTRHTSHCILHARCAHTHTHTHPFITVA